MGATAIPLLSLVLVGTMVFAAFVVLRLAFRLLLGLGRGLALAVRSSGGFLRGEVVDTIHVAGALATGCAILPLALGNLLIGRPQSAAHYGRAAEDELMNALGGAYRVVLGNPLRFLGLHALVDGFERRIPELVASAPWDPPRRRHQHKNGASFEGYVLLDRLPSGGSGARLWVARPTDEKRGALVASGREASGRVVIKSFELSNGSTLPQIVRESRALEAASRLGLVLEHELSDKSFHYVMPFVDGDGLDTVTERLHTGAGPEGLSDVGLGLVLGYSNDILSTLERFHGGGLWHKDIKPANLIISEDRAHLVDLGLVTPLQSALTLTTHGTEYYRDPEMVRLAMQGVKVHEVDGVKFDIYSAGAVLFSMVEGSFPAHGNLSRLSKRCPEALQWIIRRGMADMDQRYRSAREMRADVAALLQARDPFAVLPSELPSFRGEVPEFGPLDVDLIPAGSPTPLAQIAQDATPLKPLSRRSRRCKRRKILAATALTGLVAVGVASNMDDQRRGYAHTGPSTAGAWSGNHRPAPALPSIRRTSDTGNNQPSAVVSQTVSYGLGSWPSIKITPASAPTTGAEFADSPPSAAFAAENNVSPHVVDTWRRHLEPELPNFDAAVEGESSPRVLVLEDLSPAVDGQILLGLELALEDLGWRALGLDPDDPDAVIALAAGARKVIGLSGPTDATALRALQRHLDATTDLDAILWLTPDEEQQGQRYQLLVRSDRRYDEPAELVW